MRLSVCFVSGKEGFSRGRGVRALVVWSFGFQIDADSWLSWMETPPAMKGVPMVC